MEPITRPAAKGTVLPAALMVDINPEHMPLTQRQAEMLTWVNRHNAAVAEAFGQHMPPDAGRRRNEWRVVNACHGIAQLVRTWDAWSDERNPDTDYMMAEDVAPMLRAAIGQAVAFTLTALNWDTGRIGCGSVSSWLEDIAERVRVDSSTGELIGADPIAADEEGANR